MVHQGSERKASFLIFPYRDLVWQNEWLRENLFDAVGNYLYCQACVRSSFGISADKLARQRKIKSQCLQHPIVSMTKTEVEEKLVSAFVVMSDTVSTSFSKWWVTVDLTTVLDSHMNVMG